MTMRKNKDADEITNLSPSHDAHGTIGLGPAQNLCIGKQKGWVGYPNRGVL